jgi:broad specificity phosphatase PhoE
MKTTIYLVRHGDVHNPEQILYERLPGYRLSELGKKQAHDLGKFLEKKKIAALYASPLERTVETAGILASYLNGLRIVQDDRLIEVSTVARGRKFIDLEVEEWDFYTPKYTSQGGETLQDIWKRMQKAIGDIVRTHEGQEVVVVSHGDPIMVSMVKHKGKRLTVGAIRGEGYVQTAKGFILVFEGLNAIEVKAL